MNKGRFLFVDVVSILFQMILFVGNFLGLLYLLEGNIPFSIAGSLLLTVIYFFLIQLLVDSKELMFKNRFLHATSLFWLFYLGLAVVSGSLLSHFINVEFNVKSEIQSSAYQKLEVVSKLVTKYDSISTVAVEDYENNLKIKLEEFVRIGNQNLKDDLVNPPYNLKIESLANRNNINTSRIVNAQLEFLHLIIERNVTYLDSNVRSMNIKYENVFKNWERLDLMDTYANLNDYVDKNIVLINEMIQALPVETEKLAPAYDKSALPLSSPSELNKQYKPNYTIPIIVILIIHFFLILPFYVKEVRTYVRNKPKSIKRESDRKNKQSEFDDEPIREQAPKRPSSGGTIEL